MNLSAQNCPRPDDSYVTNGRFTPGQADTISPGQTFTIECNDNYRLEGSNILTCESGTVFKEKAYPKCLGKWKFGPNQKYALFLDIPASKSISLFSFFILPFLTTSYKFLTEYPNSSFQLCLVLNPTLIFLTVVSQTVEARFLSTILFR